MKNLKMLYCVALATACVGCTSQKAKLYDAAMAERHQILDGQIAGESTMVRRTTNAGEYIQIKNTRFDAKNTTHTFTQNGNSYDDVVIENPVITKPLPVKVKCPYTKLPSSSRFELIKE